MRASFAAEPILVKCPLCYSAQVRFESITDKNLAYGCDDCGARFQIEYPRRAKSPLQSAGPD
jgi:transposase-like protein